MALSPQTIEIIKIVGSVASGGLLIEIVRWILGKHSRRVDDTSKLASAWKELVNEFQEERVALRKQIDELKEGLDVATVKIAELEKEAQRRRNQIVCLQTEREAQALEISKLSGRNEALEKRVEILEQENGALRSHNKELMIQLSKCLENRNGQAQS